MRWWWCYVMLNVNSFILAMHLFWLILHTNASKYRLWILQASIFVCLLPYYWVFWGDNYQHQVLRTKNYADNNVVRQCCTAKAPHQRRPRYQWSPLNIGHDMPCRETNEMACTVASHLSKCGVSVKCNFSTHLGAEPRWNIIYSRRESLIYRLLQLCNRALQLI